MVLRFSQKQEGYTLEEMRRKSRDRGEGQQTSSRTLALSYCITVIIVSLFPVNALLFGTFSYHRIPSVFFNARVNDNLCAVNATLP